ncbi:uncharacterized protein PgNI_02961 [Pyricularia grisea]|uniref:Aminoglycoside phosphotransferase domain-containing protein n=1 Tax=Pyricularia grisea TaxID=148305 RepID=A0A6P8BA32_PYRGI|nr:uncharacterized protein PgNI_02961 [Pyricularia grisea]TLD12542.1 hypothetical protein PgNI_02961 [Pyricularia grisea]
MSQCPENWMEDEQSWLDFQNMAALHAGPWPAPVFTHVDFNPTEILVRGDEVVGIIDWECAGWYPVYWEYTSTVTVLSLDPKWQEIVGHFMSSCHWDLTHAEVGSAITCPARRSCSRSNFWLGRC